MSGRPAGAQAWTADEQEELLALAKQEGLSARAIAVALTDKFGRKITRGSILGRLHRMGVRMPTPERAPKAVKQRKPAAPKRSRPSPAPRRFIMPRVSIVPRPPRPEAALRNLPDPDPVLGPDGKPHTLESAPRNGCRWIIDGAGINARMCGHAQRDHSAWCEAHSARAWRRKPVDQEEEAA